MSRKSKLRIRKIIIALVIMLLMAIIPFVSSYSPVAFSDTVVSAGELAAAVFAADENAIANDITASTSMAICDGSAIGFDTRRDVIQMSYAHLYAYWSDSPTHDDGGEAKCAAKFADGDDGGEDNPGTRKALTEKDLKEDLL